MTRLTQLLIATAALTAAPLQTAFAEDASGTADPNGVPPEAAEVTPTTTEGVAVSSIIDRPLVLRREGLAAQLDLSIAHLSITIAGMTSSGTSEGMLLGAGYGVTNEITAGATYAFTLNEFEVKGPLTVYGAYKLTDNGTLAVAAGADLGVNFASDNSLAIHAGLAVRYKFTPTIAIYTGNPYTPGPSGQHLSISLEENGPKTFSLPVGVAFQGTPQLYAFMQTTLATILLSETNGGDRASFIGDSIPLTIGGFFNINNNLDAGASFATDLRGVADLYIVTLGARYFM